MIKKYDAWDHVGEQNGNLGYNESSTVAKACEIKVMIEEVGTLGTSWRTHWELGVQ